MKIAIHGNDYQQGIWKEKNTSGNHEYEWHEGDSFFSAAADVYFDLLFDDTAIHKNILIALKPVFANAVIPLMDELPGNYIRINAWNSFFESRKMEVVARTNQKEMAEQILQQLNISFVFAPDVSGMIAPRTVSMIINEAYFAAGEGVSTKEEIDIAMRLGTNYPYGPFEWALVIGLHNICSLLIKMQSQEKRYTIAPLLLQEATGNML